MTVCLERRGYRYSRTTVHKYMNMELGLHSIVRPRRLGTKPKKPHRIFENRLRQDFTAEEINKKWCTDFTYLFLKNGDVRYNCTITELHDRSVVASITDRRITGDPAEDSGFTAGIQRRADHAQRPGEPVHIKGICGIL